MTAEGLAVRQPEHIVTDSSRVITTLFVPGHVLANGNEGRAARVVEHILALSDDEVHDALAEIVERFGHRHRDLSSTFGHHADRIANRLDPASQLSDDRRSLLGATFTHEYSVAAAAICNPSAVAHPDQTGAPDGSLRFVMSVREIGEGHRSSIGFRSGTFDHAGRVSIDEHGEFTTAGTVGTRRLDAGTFRSLTDPNDDGEATRWVLEGLGPSFTIDELGDRLTELETQRDTRRHVAATAKRLRALAARSYTARFPATSELSERVLHPTTEAESNGMEDARFVRFVEDDGAVTYYATYTAFDGEAIKLQLVATTDFLTFEVSPLLGDAAANKGVALFARRIAGRFVALSRNDGASNSIAYSDDMMHWPASTKVECPSATWEAVQIGNCGSPIETAEGWLVITHGVGPMRTYSLGAWLLDLDDPTKLIGRTRQPLLAPRRDEQDGYVPNVVYSCGALLHHETLLIPFGIGDARIGFATVALADLLDELRR